MHERPAPRQVAVFPRDRARLRRRIVDETDEVLVTYAGAGDEDAWRELYRRYDGLIRSIARRMGCGHATADISQRTWELFMRSHHQIRDMTRLPGWLATTTRREAIRELTRRVPKPVDIDELPTALQPSSAAPDDDVIRAEARAELRLAVRTLPPAYRVIVGEFLNDDGRSYREIADDLGCPIGSLGPMRGRGLRLLRSQLDQPASPAARLAAGA
jgi:RNA polymerase sigma factor (sigma-70 family)